MIGVTEPPVPAPIEDESVNALSEYVSVKSTVANVYPVPAANTFVPLEPCGRIAPPLTTISIIPLEPSPSIAV